MGLKKLITAAVFALGAPIIASAATVEGPVLESGNLDGAEFLAEGQTETVSISSIGVGDFSVTVDFTSDPLELFATFEIQPADSTSFTDVTATFSFGGIDDVDDELVLVIAQVLTINSGSVTDSNGDNLNLALLSDGSPVSLTIAGTVTGPGVLEASVTAVPLPAGVVLMLTGLAGFGFVARRRGLAAA
ncbi:MAG: VPLPA-CTERM sorting domain-containing protein [Pseudomonadota bacterium]